jgi:hypothetical protein
MKNFNWHAVHKCFKEGFLFLHVPKTGGTSIERALGLHNCGCHWHSSSGDVRPGDKIKFIKKIEGWRSLKKFVFVRNPWDRLVSTYFYLRDSKLEVIMPHQPPNSRGTVVLSKQCSFKEWILSHEKKQEGLEDMNGFWLSPQKNWVGKNFFDYVGRFEQIHDHFFELFPDKVLPHLNSSKHNHYSNFYDEQTKKIVESWYEDDIVEYNYEFRQSVTFL